MQLVSLVLYSTEGDRKAIPFKLGALNVITGQSKTGKSMLVRLIDYCLGRATVPTSAGRVEEALSWVGAVWQFADSSRAFVGRPIPAGYSIENTEVMLTIGDETLEPPDFTDLQANTNTRQMRLEVGSRIGITENRLEAPAGSTRTWRTHLGHAALLCLQNQDEISSSTRIFHRSGERFIDDALRDTIPYFLGAVPPDQALLKATLRQEQRRLRRTEQDLREAHETSRDINEDLLALLGEAVEAGLAERPENPRALTRQELITVLHGASRERPADDPQIDARARQDARRGELAELAVADDELDQLIGQRALLLDESEGGSAYEDALEVQFGRLTSLGILPSATFNSQDRQSAHPNHEADSDSTTHVDNCPVCGQQATDRDATPEQLRIALEQVGARLESFRRASPARSEALDALNLSIAAAQTRVRRARAAIDASLGADATVGRDLTRRRDFTRGRIDAILSRASEAEDSHIEALEERVNLARQSVEELQARLSDDAERERLNSRLIGVGRDLTRFAQVLELEHSGRDVRIDLARLTVIADVNDSPVPLHRIGSAENWIGYHIAAHLALHQTFMRHTRPVPRILVIDQPSQGHYPSEVAKRTGVAGNDADEVAVRRLYELMNTFAEESKGGFQIIAVDHADIDSPWFQKAVVDKWRGKGKALVPEEWLPEELIRDDESEREELEDEPWPDPRQSAEELIGAVLESLLSELVNEPLGDHGLGIPGGAPPLESARISELTVRLQTLEIDFVEEHDGDILANARMSAAVVLAGELSPAEATAAEENGEVLREPGITSDMDVTVTLVETHDLEVEAGVLYNEATELCELQQVLHRRWTNDPVR